MDSLFNPEPKRRFLFPPLGLQAHHRGSNNPVTAFGLQGKIGSPLKTRPVSFLRGLQDGQETKPKRLKYELLFRNDWILLSTQTKP